MPIRPNIKNIKLNNNYNNNQHYNDINCNTNSNKIKKNSNKDIFNNYRHFRKSFIVIIFSGFIMFNAYKISLRIFKGDYENPKMILREKDKKESDEEGDIIFKSNT